MEFIISLFFYLEMPQVSTRTQHITPRTVTMTVQQSVPTATIFDDST
jgi:hypothetical protein